LLPFALSNYLYGATSVDFVSYIAATFFGFTPGSFSVVYLGSVGKELTVGRGYVLPWYTYLAIGGLILTFGQYIAKYAASVIQKIEEEDRNETDVL
jgi:uncharacterized membrane protein YdjX (TVP38/TMEM64 family)